MPDASLLMKTWDHTLYLPDERRLSANPTPQLSAEIGMRCVWIVVTARATPTDPNSHGEYTASSMVTVRNFQISFVMTFRFSDTCHTLYMNKRLESAL